MRRPAQLRRPAAIDAPTPRTARQISFPAPIGGWIRNQDLNKPGARMPDGSVVSGAYVLENHFPTTTGARMRRGSDYYAQVGDHTQPVLSLFAYVNGNNKKLFAATADALWDITSPSAASDISLVDDTGAVLVDENGAELVAEYSIDAAAVSSLGGGDWSVEQFATAGGVYLRCVNGIDDPLVYDGSAFSTLPAITGSGLDPKSLSFVWAHQRRLFFVQKNSLDAWYLPADSIGGAAVKLPLGGVFPRGGQLLFGAAWSLETGGGLSEQCAFFSTEGEVAIYQGSDPSTAATWLKVGVYRTGKPRGAKAHIRAGGDVVVATDIGFLPLSTSIQRDYAALSANAISFKIEEAWNEALADRAGDWACEIWPTKQMVLVAPPTPQGETAQIFVANARTGSWGLYTGWQANCLQLFGDRLFFGSTGGLIVEAEVTGFDLGLPYTAKWVPLFDFLKNPASIKTSLLMRGLLKAPVEIVPQLSLQADYVISLPAQPDAAPISAGSVWGTAIWNQSVWAQPASLNVYGQWQSVGGLGTALAPAWQVTSGNLVPPDLEIVRIDMTYDQGDIVT